MKPGQERELTTRAFEWWTQRLGHKPAGIRTPSWDFTGDTLAIIRDLGFAYDSSLMADDRPYEIIAEGKPTGLVELPVEWILDDYAYYSYDRHSDAYNRVGDSDVYEIYKGEFDRAYEEGTMFLLTMHPFVTGHRSRLTALDRLVAYMQSKPGVVRDAPAGCGGCESATIGSPLACVGRCAHRLPPGLRAAAACAPGTQAPVSRAIRPYVRTFALRHLAAARISG